MKDFIIMGLPWIMSVWSLAGSYLDGKKYKYSPLIKFFGQGLWLIWIPMTGNWGFMPLAILLTVIYYRNHLLWTKKEIVECPPETVAEFSKLEQVLDNQHCNSKR